ncbi:MAG TPA: GTPase HflX, partial [Bacteroidia bacterium]|nr:GTPase HflX [Bacteroidia bacterium]
MKEKSTTTAIPQHSCVLIGVINKFQDETASKEFLDELAFLAQTYGLITGKIFTQKLEKPDKATFIGKGKLAEITDYVKAHNIDVVIFDDELSPSQQRN